MVLPESIIFTEKKYQKGVGLTLQYLLGILLWTALSIKLEGEGENVFTLMWAICIFKLGMDLWVVLGFMNSVRRAKVA